MWSSGTNAGVERLTVEKVAESAEYVRRHCPNGLMGVQVAFVCGSGLGGVADKLSESVSIPFKDIPHFPVSTVRGHAGMLHSSLHALLSLLRALLLLYAFTSSHTPHYSSILYHHYNHTQ